MVVTSEIPNLAAIPESTSVSYQPASVRTSPRSTSDSPGRSSSISQHSRLLQPTLSWQAKAGWIPNPVTGTSTAAADQQADTSGTQVQVSMAAVSARNQAMAAGRRTSLISPSTSFHLRDGPQQIAAAGGDAGSTILTQFMSNSEVVQQKVEAIKAESWDHQGSSLQDESSKHGRPTAVPWQQQRLHLRPVTASASSSNSRSATPSSVHTADTAVDTLQQQRAKLKPVQTSKHAIAPVKQPAAAPLKGQGTAAAVYPSFVKATTRPAAPSQGAQVSSQAGNDKQGQTQSEAMQPVQPIASQSIQLRSKFSQLANLLQSTALQRGISLSEVAVPATRKPSKEQRQRVSLEEVKTNFRSFTEAIGATGVTASSSKSPPARRVSTGAITPAFLKEKNKQDKALLESLGVAVAGADTVEPGWQANEHSAITRSASSRAVTGSSGDAGTDRCSNIVQSCINPQSSSDVHSQAQIPRLTHVSEWTPASGAAQSSSVAQDSPAAQSSQDAQTVSADAAGLTSSTTVLGTAANEAEPVHSSTAAHMQGDRTIIQGTLNSLEAPHMDSIMAMPGATSNGIASQATMLGQEGANSEADNKMDGTWPSGATVNITVVQAGGGPAKVSDVVLDVMMLNA
ncbi:MAG: hypothetical protein FRX49_10577 [Trebouxia sp. A1-2]|nr:MAG: hypothetical protein FRX49_10577 [Trebouxia sp. A1-2]